MILVPMDTPGHLEAQPTRATGDDRHAATEVEEGGEGLHARD